MTNRILAALAIAGVLSGYTVYAHHSFAATYLENQEVGIEGTISKFMYRNPHSFLQVAAKSNGQAYMVEWGGTGQLTRTGVKNDTLKPGDFVVVKGSPGRNAADFRLRLKSIVRPKDGWSWKGVVE